MNELKLKLINQMQMDSINIIDNFNCYILFIYWNK
jgi:hypothetical protein